MERDGCVLLVASRYPNHVEPLWNLPGGRLRDGELLSDALRREFLEETGLAIEPERFAYLSESYDRAGRAHFLSATFVVRGAGEVRLDPRDAHVVDFAWVPRAGLGARLRVAVVREPLLAFLAGRGNGYFGVGDAGVSIEFADPA